MMMINDDDDDNDDDDSRIPTSIDERKAVKRDGCQPMRGVVDVTSRMTTQLQAEGDYCQINCCFHRSTMSSLEEIDYLDVLNGE